MLRPETPLSNHLQGEEQESHDKDWVHLSLELHPGDTTYTRAESEVEEGTVGETTAP